MVLTFGLKQFYCLKKERKEDLFSILSVHIDQVTNIPFLTVCLDNLMITCASHLVWRWGFMMGKKEVEHDGEK